jgi:hypothetical protein
MQLSLASLHPVHVGTNEPLEASELNWRGDLLFVRTPSELSYSFSSPCLPSLYITPEARIPDGLSSTAMVRVRINGETVLEDVLPTGAAGSQRILRAPRTSPSGEYRVELLARETDDQARALWVLWGNLQVRTDDPLDASDFSAMCEPWARRIERINHASSQ